MDYESELLSFFVRYAQRTHEKYKKLLKKSIQTFCTEKVGKSCQLTNQYNFDRFLCAGFTNDFRCCFSKLFDLNIWRTGKSLCNMHKYDFEKLCKMSWQIEKNEYNNNCNQTKGVFTMVVSKAVAKRENQLLKEIGDSKKFTFKKLLKVIELDALMNYYR